MQRCNDIDLEIPLLFAGVNDQAYLDQPFNRPYGGVVEYIDIKDTLDLLLDIHPETKNIYYISGVTQTGLTINNEIEKVLATYKGINAIKGATSSMDVLLDQVKHLPDDTVILYGVYFQDLAGDYYDYTSGIKLISQASKVPIYGLWDFTLGQGIVGGKLVSGVDQGIQLAELVLNYFDDPTLKLPIRINNSNKYKFDYQVLQAQNINTESLPTDSDIINYSTVEEESVLILHSYNDSFQWTDEINKGMTETLSQHDTYLEIYTEYMDIKRISDITYGYYFKQYFEQRYKGKHFDLILTSDDAAFKFAMDHLKTEGTDVVFCGVNYLSDDMIQTHQGYTGVMESYDVGSTISVIRDLQPNVSKIYVINDRSVTGSKNNKNVEAIEKEFPKLTFIYSGNMNMDALQKEVSALGDDTAILLMTFNKDKSSNVFSYEKSIRMIKEYANVPIYSVWNFYLGSGIVGGYLTNGYAQGTQAGEMALDILDGKSASDIPIITYSPNEYMFDLDQIKRFNLDKKAIPKKAVIINGTKTFRDLYKENTTLFNLIFASLLISIVLILVLIRILNKSKALHKQVSEMARKDLMTGVLNRTTGLDELRSLIDKQGRNHGEIQVFFIDLNNLKKVNDQYGHKEGDQFILAVVSELSKYRKPNDILCRMGGDEFMFVKYYHRTGESEDFIKQIKENLKIRSQEDKKPYVYSVSIGQFFVTDSKEMDLSEIVEAADSEMYKDKLEFHRENK